VKRSSRPPEDLKGKITNPKGQPLGKRIHGLTETGWLVLPAGRVVVEKRKK
jgi:hypothetical protein